jgi:hypothetical protein
MTQPTYVLPAPEQVDGQVADPAWANGVADWVYYLSQVVTVSLAAVVSQSGSTSVPNGPGSGTGPFVAGRTYVPWDTVEYDPTGMVNLAGGGNSNKIITALQPGLYIPFAAGTWQANATGFRTLSVDLGGDAANVVTVAQLPAVPGGSFPTVFGINGFKLLSTASLTMALRADQNSGGALSLSGAKLALFRAALAS